VIFRPADLDARHLDSKESLLAPIECILNPKELGRRRQHLQNATKRPACRGEDCMEAIVTETTVRSERADDTSTVVVVDDDVSVRESLELLIRTTDWQVETFASAADFLSRPRLAAPCCLMLDLSLPGLSGLELQRRLAGRLDMPIIFISGRGDIPTSVQAMKAGAVDFLTKPLISDVCLAAVGEALELSRTALVNESAMEALRTRYASLTPRERDVMALVVSGLLNKQAGGELGISEITVKAHRGQVMRKMKADSLAALVTMATRLGVRSAATH
jgi:FixJ family two-component response regulator